MKTRVTELLGIKHPVIQCGMANVVNPEMIVAVGEAGGLGFLPLANITVEEYRNQIRWIKDKLKGKPFGVNVSPLVPHFGEYVRVWIEEECPVWGSAIRDPFRLMGIDKPRGVIYIPTIGKTHHGLSLVKKGLADAVITHGQEGGGHPGHLSSTVLTMKTAQALDVPVIASGGFSDGRGLAAALAMGAEGIGMGTRFAMSKESTIPQNALEWLTTKQEDSPINSNKYDGVYCNVIQGDGIGKHRTWRAHPWKIPGAMYRETRHTHPGFKELWRLARFMWKMGADPIQWCVGMPQFEKGLLQGDTDKGLFWSGQVVGRIDNVLSCREIIESTVAEAEEILANLYNRFVDEPASVSETDAESQDSDDTSETGKSEIRAVV